MQCLKDLLLQFHIITQPDTPVLLDDTLMEAKTIQCFRSSSESREQTLCCRVLHTAFLHLLQPSRYH